jgi:membrane protein DedA with SNARE-associated domain
MGFDRVPTKSTRGPTWMDAAELWQYIGVFTALTISALGVPIPEEVPIITAGVLVGHGDTSVKWWIMLPVCIAGVVLCDILLYLIGRFYGKRLLEWKWFERKVISKANQTRITNNFHEYGIVILLVARLMPGVRTPMFLMSGIIHLPFRKFLFADAIYAIPGVNLLFWLSYWFTDQFTEAFQKVENAKPLIMVAVLAAVGGFFAYTLVKRRVNTGDPSEVPVIGGTVASTLSHRHVPDAEVEPEKEIGSGDTELEIPIMKDDKPA